MKSRSNTLWLLAMAAVCILTWVCNLPGAWYGHPAKLWELLVTVGYLALWLTFTRFAGQVRHRWVICTWVSALTLAANLTALWGSAFSRYNVVILPAVLLTPFSGIPLYGLRYGLDWDGTYLTGAILGALWLVWSCSGLKKTKTSA